MSVRPSGVVSATMSEHLLVLESADGLEIESVESSVSQ
jgi:hypothetical protein